MITILLIIVVGSAVLAYIPMILLVQHKDETRMARRRPINEILRDAYAEGRLDQEGFEYAIDQVHEAMPTLDMPYPKVRELERGN